MYKLYGPIGALLILLVQINFIFKVQPFANWYFPIIWYGYILVIDALVYKVKGHSLISNRFSIFLGLVLLSTVCWWLFELINMSTQNWTYPPIDSTESEISMVLHPYLSFSTVLPALFETTALIRSLHLFDKIKLKHGYSISKKLLYAMICLGLVCFFMPLLFPKIAFPLVWLCFYLILDPINYMNKQPSIIKHLKDRKLNLVLSLLFAGIILGVLWEFWNYWAVRKWVYDVPYMGFLKVFEMPILGYLGYFPFALELYAMYWFVRSLFTKAEKLLDE
jgi:hypothetical protein